MREWIDERAVKSLAAYGYQIRNKKFEATIAVSREVLEDEAHAQVRTRIESLAEAASAHYDALVFDLIKAGETANGYDNAPFYGTHQVGGVAVRNVGTASLSAATLETAIAAMMRVPLDSGEPMLLRPTHLLVPPELLFTALKLVASAFNPAPVAAGNTAGQMAANPLYGSLAVAASARLSSATEWHLLDCSRSVKPFILQQRIAPEFSALDGEEGGAGDTAFLRDELLYGVRSRDNAGFGLWQMAFKSSGEGE